MKVLCMICFVTILLDAPHLVQYKFPAQSGNARSFTGAALGKEEVIRQGYAHAEENLFTGEPLFGRTELSRAATFLPLSSATRPGQFSSGRRRFRKRPEAIKSVIRLPVVQNYPNVYHQQTIPHQL